jgi:hypothetical protein
MTTKHCDSIYPRIPAKSMIIPRVASKAIEGMGVLVADPPMAPPFSKPMDFGNTEKRYPYAIRGGKITILWYIMSRLCISND